MYDAYTGGLLAANYHLVKNVDFTNEGAIVLQDHSYRRVLFDQMFIFFAGNCVVFHFILFFSPKYVKFYEPDFFASSGEFPEK